MKDSTYHALLVTNSTFPQDPGNLLELEGPRSDAAVLRAALVDEKSGLFNPENIRLVTDREESYIRREIEDFFSTATRHDTLLLYYSGHGVLSQNNVLHLCARDSRRDRLAATTVSSTWITNVIEESAALVTVIILDCCHSGAFKGGGVAGSFSGQGRFVLASSRPEELARDADAANHASVFTSAMSEGLINGAPDLDNDGLIRIDDLHKYVDERLSNAKKPRPQRNFVGVGDVAIAARVPDTDWEIVPQRVDVGTVRIRKKVAGIRFEVVDHSGANLRWIARSREAWVGIQSDASGFSVSVSPPVGKS